MRITVECYGASQRWCGAELVNLDLGEAATVADALAIGDEIVAGGRALEEGERLALIPPVSGG